MPTLTASQIIRLSKTAQRYFSREEVAQKMMSEIVPVIEDKYEVEKNRIATKDDMASVGQNLRQMQTELQVEIRGQISEMIKWMFVFRAGTLAAMIMWC